MSWWIPGTRLPTKPWTKHYCIIMIIIVTGINIFSLPANGVHEILTYQSFVSLCKKCTWTFSGYHRRSLYSRREHAEAKKKKQNKTNIHMLKKRFIPIEIVQYSVAFSICGKNAFTFSFEQNKMNTACGGRAGIASGQKPLSLLIKYADLSHPRWHRRHHCVSFPLSKITQQLRLNNGQSDWP